MMERRLLKENKCRYEYYLPSSSTLHLVEKKLNVVLNKRFGKIKLRAQNKLY